MNYRSKSLMRGLLLFSSLEKNRLQNKAASTSTGLILRFWCKVKLETKKGAFKIF